MENIMRVVHRQWVLVITALGLSMLGTVALSPVSAQTGPGTLCVVQITTDGSVLGVLVDQVENFNLAVLVPEDKNVNVPVVCSGLETLGLGITNQRNNNVNFTVQVFTNNGVLICSKGPFQLPVNGGRGVTFSDCL